MNITKIRVVLSSALFWQDGYDSQDCRDDAKRASDELEERLMDKYPDAHVDVDWTTTSMPTHRIEVQVDGEPCGQGDRAFTDVRDIVLEVHEEVSNGTTA